MKRILEKLNGNQNDQQNVRETSASQGACSPDGCVEGKIGTSEEKGA